MNWEMNFNVSFRWAFSASHLPNRLNINTINVIWAVWLSDHLQFFGNSLEPLAAPPMRYTTSRHSTIQTFTCCHYLRQILENNYPSVNMSVCLVKSSFMLLYLHSVAVRRSTDRYGSVIFPSGHAKKRCTRSTRCMFCFPVQLSPWRQDVFRMSQRRCDALTSAWFFFR